MTTAVNDKAPMFSVDHVGLLQALHEEPDSNSGGLLTIRLQAGRGSQSSRPIMRSLNAVAYSLLVANMNSLPLDWAARLSVGGTDMSHFIIKQLPVLSPREYIRRHMHDSTTYVEMIIPRVLELVYTADNLATYAKDLGHDGPPFVWDDERRHLLRCELDAIYAHMYKLERTDLEWVLDSQRPSVSFTTLKRRELQEFGEFRTKRLVLESYDRLATGNYKEAQRT